MILTKEQILATATAKTETVDVPEWYGPEAQVRLGVIGGLASVRLQDWLGTLGRPIEGLEAKQASRIDQLSQGLRTLLEAARSSIGSTRSTGSPSVESLQSAIEEAEHMLGSPLPDRTFSQEENYRYALRWCAESIVTESGEKMFTLDEIEALGRLDRAPIHRIAAAAQALNLATRQSRKDAEKNSGTTTTESSGSD